MSGGSFTFSFLSFFVDMAGIVHWRAGLWGGIARVDAFIIPSDRQQKLAAMRRSQNIQK
jgi:hypothetical protein